MERLSDRCDYSVYTFALSQNNDFKLLKTKVEAFCCSSLPQQSMVFIEKVLKTLKVARFCAETTCHFYVAILIGRALKKANLRSFKVVVFYTQCSDISSTLSYSLIAKNRFKIFSCTSWKVNKFDEMLGKYV